MPLSSSPDLFSFSRMATASCKLMDVLELHCPREEEGSPLVVSAQILRCPFSYWPTFVHMFILNQSLWSGEEETVICLTASGVGHGTQDGSTLLDP